MKHFKNFFSLGIFTLLLSTSVLAQSHKGQMDTDGILSKGEIPNPHINYRDHNKQKHRVPQKLRPSASEPHRGKVDSDGILSSGEISNPLINYNARRHEPYWYRDHDWDHRWDKYDEGYWQRNPERRWWGKDDTNWRRDERFGDVLHDGLRSGRISGREERELRGMRADLLRSEQEYWNDGYLSKREREDLEDRAADLRKAFNHELNDGEYRR